MNMACGQKRPSTRGSIAKATQEMITSEHSLMKIKVNIIFSDFLAYLGEFELPCGFIAKEIDVMILILIYIFNNLGIVPTMSSVPRPVHWQSTFERDTLTMVLAQFVQRLLISMSARPEFNDALRQYVQGSRHTSGATLAEFDFGPQGILSVGAIGRPVGFVVVGENDECSFQIQVVAEEDSLQVTGLRIAEFSGDSALAVGWVQGLSQMLTGDTRTLIH